jgi:hypothetical protein
MMQHLAASNRTPRDDHEVPGMITKSAASGTSEAKPT